MGFKTGHERLGGRKRGTPNKATTDVRASFQQLVQRNVGKLQEGLERVAADDPAKFVDLVARLAEFCIPKLARAEMTGVGGTTINVTVRRFSEEVNLADARRVVAAIPTESAKAAEAQRVAAASTVPARDDEGEVF
ncbi:MAG TPA: hypothetical protein VMG11_08055 [Steroidobacteraceae bacterium]|nr:hypothetical protein [Steroidobacteraceae bacterium]